MALDTLAYAKHLQDAGVERRQAEAHAEAINHDRLPDLATKADLAATEQRIIAAFESRLHQVEIRMLGVVAAMLGLLFALLKFTPG
ncbi:MAG TPA: hypothetical protein VHG31_01815 [Stellaceae bacterium]|nr:hypothetical protein [Stellaceae bacterium]